MSQTNQINHLSKANAILDSFNKAFSGIQIRSFKKTNKIGEFYQIVGSKNYEFGDVIPIVKIETSTKPNTTVHAKLRVNDDYYDIFNTMFDKNIFDGKTGDFSTIVESFDDAKGYNHINFVLMSKPNVSIVDAFRKVNDVLIPSINKLIQHYAEVVIPEQAAAYTATNADFPALSTTKKASANRADSSSNSPTNSEVAPAAPAAPAAQSKDDFPPIVNPVAPTADPVAPTAVPVAPATPTPAPTRAFTPVQAVPADVSTQVHSPIVTHASNPQKHLFPRPMMHPQQQFPFPPMGMPMCQPPFIPFNGITKEGLDAERMQINDLEMRINAMRKDLDFMKQAHSLNIDHYNRIVSLRQDSETNPNAWQEVTIEQ